MAAIQADDEFGPGSVTRAASALRTRLDGDPDVLIVLGSGLADLVDSVEDQTVVDFADIPGFPATSVAGHSGRYVFGHHGGRNVLVQVGRFHAYEGHSTDVVVAPVRIAAAIGVGTMIVTNAAGGLRGHLPPGSLVLLDDHINFMFRSPLAGPVHGSESRFPDMSRPYDTALQALALEVAGAQGIELQPGVYAGVLGPNYETPAEVRMLASSGADVVGMSTVPEVIAARALGLRVLGISVVTNPAAGLAAQGEILSHDEVLEMGKGAASRLGTIVEGVLAAMK